MATATRAAAVSVGVVSLCGCTTVGHGLEHFGGAIETLGLWVAGEGAQVAIEGGNWLTSLGESIGGPVGIAATVVGGLITTAGGVASLKNSEEGKLFGPVVKGRKWCGLRKAQEVATATPKE